MTPEHDHASDELAGLILATGERAVAWAQRVLRMAVLILVALMVIALPFFAYGVLVGW